MLTQSNPNSSALAQISQRRFEQLVSFKIATDIINMGVQIIISEVLD